MSQTRLATALDEGLLSLPEGGIALLRPAADWDAEGLTPADLTVVHGFRPDMDAWAARGATVTRDMPECDLAIVVVPRSKSLARAQVAQAASSAARVLVDGQKTDGVDSLFKECRKRLGDLPSVTKGHGRLFWFDRTDAFADWAAPPPALGDHGFHTTAGVFSDGAVDKGSALLAEALTAKLPARMADFGAGWGYLSQAVLTRDGVTSLDLIEAEALSLDCARLNVTDPRAGFLWADATRHKPKEPYGGIVMNPPFHTGRAGDPALGRAFIAAAAAALSPNGQLWMVANRHLPYETALRERFRTVDEIGGDRSFKLFHATRPLR
ncbi:class I SAM-dependent methyltransferase [Loktanella sp. IMCC34160]|uniref:class I SAM-dependent methyltransferase n=1 Tax=Loktanella sp. IMCC34160 TaxID=2510646 RepID=UPI00101CC56E|nr:methyltransferase [Loktanella sp. IMCC34160]RYG91575.1 class I SAM-dependent methyltransferase [Loktanella sp. IMCC34160]